MDSTKNQLADRLKQRFLAFRERHNEMHTRYVNRMPMMQVNERNDAQQILQRFRSQPPKTNKSKQYDNIHKQLKSATEPSNNTNSEMNGSAYTNNNDMLKVAQKRNYEQFNGTANGIVDDTVNKIARLAENNQYQQKQQQHSVKTSSYETNSNVQPNVNPFQQQQQQNISSATKNSTNQSSIPNTSAIPPQAISSSKTNAMSAATNIINKNENSNRTPKVENMSPSSSIKTEVNNTASCSNTKTQNLMNVSNNDNNTNNPTSSQQYQQQYSNENSLRGLGDLDNLNSYELFGEITGNTRKNIKTEDKAKINTSTSKFNNNLTSQQQQNTWKDISKSVETSNSSNIILSSNPTSTHVPSQANTNNPLSNLMNSTQLPHHQQSNMTNMNQNTPLSNLNQLTSNIQNNRMSTSNNNTMNNQMTSSLINANNARNPIMSQQTINNLPNNVQSRQSVNNIQQPSVNSSSVLLPLNTNNNLQQTPVPPPNLQRTPNLRQQIADRLKTPQQQQQQNVAQQQQQQSMMQNMQQGLNNPFMQNSAPTTAEKLQEHLKRREHYRMLQMQQQQQQMPKSNFMSHAMMTSPMQNQMQQSNPFQFPNEFSNYNQQMGMQSAAQQNMGGYYSQMYGGMENGGAFPVPGAPPGYNQQNRAGALLRNYLRDRQHEMYNSSMGNIRAGLTQPGMFNTPNKAPPQYQHQSIPQAPVDAQQIMLTNNAAVAAGMQPRLSHFSQPDSLGMSPAMRMRGSMNHLGRYPAPPNLSRPDGLTNTNQFANQFSNNQMSTNMGVMNPNQQTYNQTWSNEPQQQQQQQQQLLMMRKEAQRQQLMNLQQQQRLQQQQQQQQITDHNQLRHSNNMLDTLGTPNDLSRFNNTNNQTKFNNPADVQSINNSNNPSSTVTPNQTQTTLPTNNTENMINETASTLTETTDTTTEQDSSGIDDILPGSAEDLDNFLNNPNETFDLVAMF